jgi:4-amino-4-deoxychorismate lyase
MSRNKTVSLDLRDRVFLGEGLFETLKIQNSKPCFSKLHWKRLYSSAHSLGLNFSLSADEWEKLLLERITKDRISEGGIKVILSGGVAPRGLTAPGKNNKLLFQTFTYSKISKPVSLVRASWLRDASNPIYQLKTINYLEAIIARQEAIRNKFDDALFFNLQNHAMETTCANLFIVNEDAIITPPLKDGVLPGITRYRVLELCSQLKIPHAEKSISQEMLQSAESVFTTNSLQSIVYISSFEGRIFSVNHPLVEQVSLRL